MMRGATVNVKPELKAMGEGKNKVAGYPGAMNRTVYGPSAWLGYDVWSQS